MLYFFLFTKNLIEGGTPPCKLLNKGEWNKILKSLLELKVSNKEYHIKVYFKAIDSKILDKPCPCIY